MGRYATIKSDVYEDKAFKALSMQAKFIYLYLLSCPYCNFIGYFYIDIDKAAIDTKIPPAQIADELARKRDKPLWMYDEKESTVLILNYLKYNKARSQTQINGIAKQIQTYSASPLLPHFINQVRIFVTEDISSIFGKDTEMKLAELSHTK